MFHDNIFIYGFWVLLLVILYQIFKRKLELLLDWLLDRFLEAINLRRLQYKKKTKDILKDLEELTEEKVGEQITKDFKFVEADEIKEKDPEWKIIFVKKEYDPSRIEKSVIIQIPFASSYFKERNMMGKSFLEAFMLQLSYSLAIKRGLFDLTSEINKIAEERNIIREFQLFYEIVKDKDKFRSFIDEARERWTRPSGRVSPTSVKEFSIFIEDLSKGNFGTVRIEPYVPYEEYISKVRRYLTSPVYQGVYVYARDKSVRGFKILMLDKLVSDIGKEFKNVTISLTEPYDWLDLENKPRIKARSLKITKK